MSGGVDSSVAAWLLKEQGYDVIGVTMQIWQDEDNAAQEENGGCCGLSAVDDARRVANMLEIPYYVMNFKNEFKENVIDYFIGEYLDGRTPNPCIACNRYVKWGISLKEEYRNRRGLYCDRPLRQDCTDRERKILSKNVRCHWERPDICAVQSDPAPALPYTDACGSL
mgnify:CR=1 FL=1